MARTYNRLELDVNKKPNSIGIRPVQNDTKSRYLDVCLYENGVPINLTGEQVRITFRKADGSIFFNQGEVTDATEGRCQFALTNEILSEAKAVESQISVWNAGGQILSTQVFEIYVTAAIPWTDAVESENEYGVLVVLFQEIQDALDTMHKIAATFGEPGDKAAEYGVDTFWGILETLAQRGDVESSLQKGIKAYLNSTVGTSGFQSLDKIISELWGGVTEYATQGTYQFRVPKNVHSIKVTACGSGGAGSAAKGSASCGGGGGSGGAAIQRIFTVTPLSTINITVGSGGAGTNTVVSSDAFAANGNATVVGTLVTLAGGYGGDGGVSDMMFHTVSVGNGSGRGGVGSSAESAGGITSDSYGGDGITDFPFFGTGGKCTSSSKAYRGGGGGGGSLGSGGSGGTSADPAASGNKGGGGAGGYGRSASNTVGKGGNGGSGGQVVMGTYNVTPNTMITITVGKGGAGGAGFQSGYGNTGTGGAGGDGYVKIEWGLAAL